MKSYTKNFLILIPIIFNFGVLCPAFISSAEEGIIYLNGEKLKEVECQDEICYFPGKTLGDRDLVIQGELNWERKESLVLQTKGNIVFPKDSKLTMADGSNLTLKAGMEPGAKKICEGTIKFQGEEPQIKMLGQGKIRIYYQPQPKKGEHKYYYGEDYLFRRAIEIKRLGERLTVYALVNNVEDLQNMDIFLSGDYALSQDVDADNTRSWNGGRGFEPLKDDEKNMPFSGDFDGNGYAIKNLYIHRPDEKYVGLFGRIQGRRHWRNKIENLTLENFRVEGKYYVGSLAGSAINSDILGIKVINPLIISRDIAGGIVGTTVYARLEPVEVLESANIIADENKGLLIGGGEH